MDPADEPEAGRLEAAAMWRVRLAEARLSTTPAFEAWLAADPENARAWDRAEAAWGAVGAVGAAPEMIAARRDALDRARRSALTRGPGRGVPRRWVAAGVAALAAGGGSLWWMGQRSEVFETGVGERRSVVLPDGSRVALDAGTRVAVRYSRDRRRLELGAGQARFDVAHDATRPFTVTAGDRTVVATGTSFNVERLGGEVLVTLLEGSVSVLRAGRPAAAPVARLRPGQRLVAPAAPDAVATIVPVSAEKATAWETGSLVFEDEPLATVVQRVSRHTAQKVTVTDPAVAGLRISGVFKAGDLTTFVDTLTAYLPVDASPRADGDIALTARPGA